MALSFSALQKGVNPVVVPDRTKRFKDISDMQTAVQNRELRSVQIEGARGELDAQKAAQAKAAAVLEALTANGGDFAKALPVIKTIDPAFGMSVEKSLLEQRNTQGQIDDRATDNTLAREKFTADTEDARLKREADAKKPTVVSPGAGVMQPGERMPSWTQPFAPKTDSSTTPFEVWRQQNPDAPVSDFMKLQTDNKAPVAEPLHPVDDGNGNITYVPRSQAIGKKVPVSSQNKASTGVEKNAMGFYIQAKDALTNIDRLEADIGNLGTFEQGKLKFAPNLAQSQTGQSYNQAQRTFTESRLRAVSGAAIQPFEYVNDGLMYFAQPGDTKETLQQKKVSRQAVMDGIKQKAGRAYSEYYGEEKKSDTGASSGNRVRFDAQGNIVK